VRRRFSVWRAALAATALAGGLSGLAGLYFLAVPEGNREPLLLALGLVLGWGSTIIGAEFGPARPPEGARQP